MMPHIFAPVHVASGEDPAIIWCTSPERRLTLAFRPHVVRQGGVQGWEERRHARGQATTEWVGKRLHTLHLMVLLSAHRQGRLGQDVESECALLHQMMVGPDWGRRQEPVPVRLNFGPGQQLRWVITNLVWGDRPVIDGRGRRTQTTVTVELLEHVTTVLAGESPAQLALRWRSQH